MIVGITGTLGAGKGTVVDYLKTKSFKHFSVRSFLIEEIERRGMHVDRDSMTSVANDLRAAHGSSYILEQLFNRAAAEGGDAVIESIRSIGEADYFKSHGGLLWSVDADKYARYERIVKRASETDKISFEKFSSDEERELANTDPTKQNLTAVMHMADTAFINNGIKEDFYAQVEKALNMQQNLPTQAHIFGCASQLV